MYCPHCGQLIKDGDKFCEFCGGGVSTNNVIKPLVTNVGYDDSLPKNSNFAFVIILSLFVIISCFIFLSSYKNKYNYNISVNYKNHTFYYPVGYVPKLETTDGQELLYIHDDSISYLFKIDTDNYMEYYNNDCYKLKNELRAQGFTDIKINLSYKDDGLILATFITEEHEYYYFLYNLNEDKDEIVQGYIYSKSDITNEDLAKLHEILTRIK